ncbi:hypothetical protein V8C86DRAFT_2877883 [Haematococcus lacustris]|uniref:Uncharacterized protein n=1 Tax=Haematococcus lacustris TaxID=44745 RepID=A0A699YXA6_HAELA|nr:uncharacterized protein HaLaN_06975 [Haematococcus lacustris]
MQEPSAPVAQEPNSAALSASTSQSSKRPRNRANLRKRPTDDDAAAGADGSEDATVVTRKAARGIRGEPLTFNSHQEVADKEVHVTFDTSRTIQSGRDESVFKALETETATDHDARALREAVLRQTEDGAVDDGVYRGVNGYIDYKAGFRREHTVASEKGSGTHGPLRANMYVRMTALMDYNPCICKDYKETGFCSYGDSCKFMHDRGDYKMSWELDRDWEEEQKRKTDEKMRALQAGEDEDEAQGNQAEDDDLPFACFICRKPWGEAKNPVVTRCKHYFCESCALKRNAKSSKCAVCEQPTQGIFNVAQDIVKKMKRNAGS